MSRRRANSGAVLVFVAIVGFIAAPQLPAHTSRDRRALRIAIRKPAFGLIALGFSLLAMEHGMLIAHIFPFLDERGFPVATAVLTASIFGPMQVAE